MKTALLIVALVLITGSVYADYRWKRWMEERKKNRDE